MSVLKLRRDMVVVEDGPETDTVSEIERPFPLRKLGHEQQEDLIEGEIADPEVEAEADEEGLPHRKTFLQQVKFWFNASAIVALLAAYPTMVIVSSDVGDKHLDQLVNRAEWAAPWAGGVATLMEQHFEGLGWASDAEAWQPMARLTAKPAYQSAMADSLGDVLRLANAHGATGGVADPDLEAASRLVSEDSTAVQLRAARDALVNFDRRQRRRDEITDLTAKQVADQVALVNAWALASQTQINTSTASIGGSPMDEDATRAVYAAKGRATVAYITLASMQWPESPEAAKARAEAMAAWKKVAEFHPLIVLNGDPDGSVFGNHPTAVGFLIARAESATSAFQALVARAVSAPVGAAPALGAAGASGAAP